MSCQNSESCCCKIKEVSMLESMLLGLWGPDDDGVTKQIKASEDPVAIRTLLIVKTSEARIMRRLDDIERKLNALSSV
ncbi:hypothetical protein [Acidithiobacillus sp.]|uniref:hypothetical protein n=1 Tax=Acidithiobacillus sp. TaxID=1872118 RepID=UPI0023239665|nr:hypothetical protein [Acidithiobacillus sp.]MDA8246955.1 hypothetical protein [Acidithiobacillus sp.]